MMHQTVPQASQLSLLADDSGTIARLSFQKLTKQIAQYLVRLKQRLDLDDEHQPVLSVYHNRRQQQLLIECRRQILFELTLQGCSGDSQLRIDSAEQEVVFYDRTVVHGSVLLKQRCRDSASILSQRLCTEAQARFALLSEAKLLLASQISLTANRPSATAAYS